MSIALQQYCQPGEDDVLTSPLQASSCAAMIPNGINHANAAKRDSTKPVEEWCGEDFEPLDDCDETTPFKSRLRDLQRGASRNWRNLQCIVLRAAIATALLAYVAYFVMAMNCGFGDDGSIRLAMCTAVAVACVAYHLVKKHVLSKQFSAKWRASLPGCQCWKRWHRPITGVFAFIIIGAIMSYIIYDVARESPRNLLSALGMIVFLLLTYITSFDTLRVRWRPVIMGLLLQITFSIIILRTSVGRIIFAYIGERVREFLEHADAGAAFVFGAAYVNHFFAFKIGSIIIFFSSIMSILYHVGVMQVVTSKIAWVMQQAMGTTAAESLCAAVNIFVGMTESPLVIRPLLPRMTNSEIHAVFTAGFATVAGSVMGTYIQYGVSPSHLLSASVMSAPAALAISKLSYPETKKSRTTLKDVKNVEQSSYSNVIEAASDGASQALQLVGNICAGIISFLSILHFVNATLGWLGERICMRPGQLSFQLITSYVLWPIPLAMGVDVAECRQVARLIGEKLFLNEFIAYEKLGVLIKNREKLGNSTEWMWQGDDVFDPITNSTLYGGILSERSEVISTYALCGFANISSIAIVLGAFNSFIPHRASDNVKLATRAMICGNVVSFLNACVAGLLFSQAA